MKFSGPEQEYFELGTSEHNPSNLEQKEGRLTLVWFEEDDNVIYVDNKKYELSKNTIVCYTWLHKVEFRKVGPTKYLQFNTPFYCILDHDSEVGCKGILFFGSRHLPVLSPNSDDTELLETVWKMLRIEMKSVDNLQLEMLQMMLKRILILCTRIYKSQGNFEQINNTQVDIIREFNFLVEKHFKEKHTVAEYASLLNKSPKTLSNLFNKLNHKTPLQLIQERKMLESRRLLKYTDMTISDVAYEVGFNDVQSFSRFFRKHQSIAPSEFRNN